MALNFRDLASGPRDCCRRRHIANCRKPADKSPVPIHCFGRRQCIEERDNPATVPPFGEVTVAHLTEGALDLRIDVVANANLTHVSEFC